eukprot:1515679-Ditylum_brightwellii.AAC.1
MLLVEGEGMTWQANDKVVSGWADVSHDVTSLNIHQDAHSKQKKKKNNQGVTKVHFARHMFDDDIVIPVMLPNVVFFHVYVPHALCCMAVVVEGGGVLDVVKFQIRAHIMKVY